jgi:hypothetical protein
MLLVYIRNLQIINLLGYQNLFIIKKSSLKRGSLYTMQLAHWLQCKAILSFGRFIIGGLVVTLFSVVLVVLPELFVSC